MQEGVDFKRFRTFHKADTPEDIRDVVDSTGLEVYTKPTPTMDFAHDNWGEVEVECVEREAGYNLKLRAEWLPTGRTFELWIGLTPVVYEQLCLALESPQTPGAGER